MAVQGEREVLKKGAAQPMLVQLEDRAGGRKHITRITGACSRPYFCTPAPASNHPRGATPAAQHLCMGQSHPPLTLVACNLARLSG